MNRNLEAIPRLRNVEHWCK